MQFSNAPIGLSVNEEVPCRNTSAAGHDPGLIAAVRRSRRLHQLVETSSMSMQEQCGQPSCCEEAQTQVFAQSNFAFESGSLPRAGCAAFGRTYLKSRVRAVDREVDDLSRSQGSIHVDHMVHDAGLRFPSDLSSGNLGTQTAKK